MRDVDPASTENEPRPQPGLGRRILKFFLQLITILVAVYLLLFWNLIFHDPDEVRDWVVDRMLHSLRLNRDDIEITRSYSDPPTFSGDSSHAVCARIKSGPPPTINLFVPGSTIGDSTAYRLADLTKLLRQRAQWLPEPGAVLTDAYLIRLLEEDFQKTEYVSIPVDRPTSVCYVYVKI